MEITTEPVRSKLSQEHYTTLQEFLSVNKSNEVNDLAAHYPQKKSLEVDFVELSKFNPMLADELLASPDGFIEAAEKILASLNPQSIVTTQAYKPHFRVFNLPDVSLVRVQDLGAASLDKLIKVEGVTSWVTDIYPIMKVSVWECEHCWSITKLTTSKVEPLKAPPICKCSRNKFRLLEEKSEFVNLQRARMQELVERMTGGSPTVHVDAWMEDDLTNMVNPGEKLVISAILRLKPNKDGKGRSSVYNKFLDVIHIYKMQQEFEMLEITPEEEKQIRELAAKPNVHELISQSIAPSIYGYQEMKQAIALQLFGGTPGKVLPDGQRIRSDIHTLLVGDPGTAKSSIIQYIMRLAPKAIFTSGKGASGVGLTASAEKDEIGGGWILKAGAMVLASGGIIGIDEFDKMEKEDRSALHEAMEQQKISIAKAGIVTTFTSRTAVLAAANPKFGRFDPNAPPATQFEIPPTLLSRFDLIFTIKDTIEESRDRRMAEHILLGHTIAAQKLKPADDSAILPEVTPELLRKYIAYARRSVFPILTNEAVEKVKTYYLELRQMGKKNNTFPVTARQIEGIIRLSEASAKLRLSERVELADAEKAVALSEFVLRDVFTDKETGLIDSDIITIGQPKSKIDKVRSLLSIIQSLEKEFDLVDIDDVVKKASEVSIDDATARKHIDELKRVGDLYEPKPGYIKSARKKESW